VAAIPLQDEAKLRQFHNRVLNSWPASVSEIGPVDYFKAAGKWLSDRAYPIIAASLLQKRLLFYVLHTTPQPRVSLGLEGHVFVNGQSDATVNGAIRGQCLAGQQPGTIEFLERRLNNIDGFARHLGMTLRTVLFPTTPTLYADFLPPSIPKSLRDACKSVLENGSPFSGLARLRITYPFAEMKALRGDPAFYPIANFHPAGYSLKIARDAYLRDEGIALSIDESLRPVVKTSEILSSYGINKGYLHYEIINRTVLEDAGTATLATELRGFFSNPPELGIWVNSSPDVSRTAIVLSDSFGRFAAPVFAAAFKRLIWINLAGSRDDMLATMLERLAREQKADAMILLFHEGNLPAISAMGLALHAP
jgi:hypothetical protein